MQGKSMTSFMIRTFLRRIIFMPLFIITFPLLYFTFWVMSGDCKEVNQFMKELIIDVVWYGKI